MQVFSKKMQKNLVNSKKSSTFAPAFRKTCVLHSFPRDANQRSVCRPKSESTAKIHMSDIVTNRIEP